MIVCVPSSFPLGISARAKTAFAQSKKELCLSILLFSVLKVTLIQRVKGSVSEKTLTV